MTEKRETQKDTPTFPPKGAHDPQREKQLAHGAQSDQGGKGQELGDGGGDEPRAYEGPEESNQQRR